MPFSELSHEDPYDTTSMRFQECHLPKKDIFLMPTFTVHGLVDKKSHQSSVTDDA
jgi:hypothetical protein